MNQVAEHMPPLWTTMLTSSSFHGSDTGTSVSDDYTPQTSQFTGTVKWVQLDAGDDNHDHLITPEDRLKVAMARH
jgi:hypothetical protein